MSSPETSPIFYNPEEHNEALVDNTNELRERLEYLQPERRQLGESEKFWKGLGRQKEMARLAFELDQREKEAQDEVAQLAGTLALSGVSGPEEEM